MRFIDLFEKRHKLIHNGRFQKFEVYVLMQAKYNKINQNCVRPYFAATFFQLKKFQTNWKTLWTSRLVAHPA